MQNISLQDFIILLNVIGIGVAFMLSPKAISAMIAFGNWWLESRERRLKMIQAAKEADKLFSRTEDEKLAAQISIDEQLNDKGHKYIIRRQDSRITTLEKNQRLLSIEIAECTNERASLRNEVINLTARVKYCEDNHLLVTGENDSKVRRYLERNIRLERLKKEAKENVEAEERSKKEKSKAEDKAEEDSSQQQ